MSDNISDVFSKGKQKELKINIHGLTHYEKTGESILDYEKRVVNEMNFDLAKKITGTFNDKVENHKGITQEEIVEYSSAQKWLKENVDNLR